MSALTKKQLLLSISLIIFSTVMAQQDTVNLVSREKLHIHTDKEVYLPGETIWFKVYLQQGYFPAIGSTNLYAELFDQTGVIIQRSVLPIIDASCNGSLQLSDTATGVNFFIRAYTAESKKDTDFIYTKPIRVLTQKKTAVQVNTIFTTNLHFFPEGGRFINGVENRVAFKATYSNAMPYPVKAVIKNNNGVMVDSIAEMHNGMGIFSITPNAGEKYYAEWIDNTDVIRKTFLPEAVNNGITLHAEEVNKHLYYVIQKPATDSLLTDIKVVAYLQQKIVYSAKINIDAAPVVSGKIPLSQLPTGIMQITVFDRNEQPLAERISFINNNNYSFDASVNILEKKTGIRERNTIEITVPDTLSANLSVSVYDGEFNNNLSGNIYSDLLFGNDIKGYVHEPAWYFNGTNAEKKKALDLVMQTNGWRRYQPQIKPADEDYIPLTGTVLNDKKLIQSGQSVTLMLQQKDSTKQFYTVVTNDKGIFTKSGFIYYDTITVWYQFNQKNKTAKEMSLLFGKSFSNTSPTTVQLPFVPVMMDHSTAVPAVMEKETATKFLSQKITDGFTAKGYKLDDVTVKSRKWRTDPMYLMDEKYASGTFRGGATVFSFDVMNDPMANAKGDIMNYLLGKVPGLSLAYPRGGTIGGFKRLMYNRDPLKLIYIDEHPFRFDTNDAMAYTEIQNLNIEDIAYIKFYSRDPLEPLTAALAIYLKKGDEIDTKKMSVLPKIKLPGYTTVKEFYSPDYSVPNAKPVAADLRTTLYWQPYLLTDKTNHKAIIHFYNNDVSSSLFMVLEGMNEVGKLIRVEKKIE